MTLPKQQLSVVFKSKGVAELVSDAKIPTLRPDYVLVKVHSVALNPTDWKHVDFVATVPGIRLGCDYSGIVEEVGMNLSTPFKKGDRIAGLVHGANDSQPEDGAFAEYIVAKSGTAIHVPDSLPLEHAATLGVGVATAGQGLYQSLGLPLPGAKDAKTGTVLIYGGSTATGSLAIQFAKLSGWKVVTTCSPRNFELVKKCGADAVFDYNDPECAKKIREFTSDSLAHVLDCISLPDSAKICADSFGKSGGKYSALLSVQDFPRKDVQNVSTLAYTALGESFHKFGQVFDAKPDDYAFQISFWLLTEQLIKEGKISVHPPQIGKDGLKGVLEGMDLLRKNKVSGTKLVYRVADTPK
ncbi:zinc-binding oxidoreductase ToxD [Powellomyces hirtus]|nr:zinc-binding oxidoreductase ToxD [Powellomyces hirtus]